MTQQTTVCLIAHVPAGTEQQFLQYIRDYDTANEGCQLEILIDTPHRTYGEMIELLKVSPHIPLREIIKRKRA